MGQFISKDRRIAFSGEVATALSPDGECMHDALMSCRTEYSRCGVPSGPRKYLEHNIGRHLRPELWKVNVMLLKDDGAVFPGNQRLTFLPHHFIVWTDASACKIPLQRHTRCLACSSTSYPLVAPGTSTPG